MFLNKINETLGGVTEGLEGLSKTEKVGDAVETDVITKTHLLLLRKGKRKKKGLKELRLASSLKKDLQTPQEL